MEGYGVETPAVGPDRWPDRKLDPYGLPRDLRHEELHGLVTDPGSGGWLGLCRAWFEHRYPTWPEFMRHPKIWGVVWEYVPNKHSVLTVSVPKVTETSGGIALGGEGLQIQISHVLTVSPLLLMGGDVEMLLPHPLDYVGRPFLHTQYSAVVLNNKLTERVYSGDYRQFHVNDLHGLFTVLRKPE